MQPELKSRICENNIPSESPGRGEFAKKENTHNFLKKRRAPKLKKRRKDCQGDSNARVIGHRNWKKGGQDVGECERGNAAAIEGGPWHGGKKTGAAKDSDA